MGAIVKRHSMGRGPRQPKCNDVVFWKNSEAYEKVLPRRTVKTKLPNFISFIISQVVGTKGE